jgi:ATP:ADP antiporter, AAA family
MTGHGLAARLASRLGLPPDEAHRALLLGLILFALTGSFTLARTSRDAVFLARLPATLLPYVYLGVGAFTMAAALGVAHLTRRWPVRRLLADGAAYTAVSLLVFAAWLQVSARLAAVAFYLWVNVYSLVLFSQFWIFANSLSNPREARRTFGFIGAAGILGGLFGGLLAPPLSAWTPGALVPVAALLVVPVAQVARALGRGTPEAENRPCAEEDRSPSAPLRHPYVRWLALMTLSAVVVTGLVDYQFKVELQARYHTAGDLASVLGLFYAGVSLTALAVQLFLTRALVRRVGAGWSAALLPAGLGLGAAVTIALPGLGSVLVTRLWDLVLRFSVNRVAGELFYFPIEPGLRCRARNAIEAAVRGSDALAGVVILGVGLFAVANTRAVAIATAAVVAVSLLAWSKVRRGYVTELARNVRRLQLDPAGARVSLREAGLLEEMTRLLGSPLERRALQSIEVLEENAPELLRERLGELLGHRSPRVRARSLALTRVHGMALPPGQLETLLRDEAPEVRAEALRAQAALLGRRAMGDLTDYLAATDVRVRTAAIVSLIERHFAAEEDPLRDLIAKTLADGSPPERLAVAQALGRRDPDSLHGFLTPLLDDPDPAVRAAALVSAGQGQRREHVPALVEALGGRGLSEAARAGLVAFGDRVSGTLGDYLCDPAVPMGVRLGIPQVLGEIGSQGAVDALFRYREGGHLRLAYRVLKAENRIRMTNPEAVFPRGRVVEEIARDVERHLSALVHRHGLADAAPPRPDWLLRLALGERMDYAQNRVFRRLGLIYEPTEIHAAYRAVRSRDPRRAGAAAEYLENALAPDHWRLVEPVAGDLGDDGRLRLAASRYGLLPLPPAESLEAIIRSDDHWLKTLAFHVAGTRGEKSLLPLTEAGRSADDPWVREAAGWAYPILAAR